MIKHRGLERLWTERVHTVVSAGGILALCCLTLGATLFAPKAVGATVLGAAAGGTTHYVSPTGRDIGTCTLVAPCGSFQYATSMTHPGDTVQVGSGAYGPQIIVANGSAAAPIKVQAAGRVTLTRQAPANGTSQATPLLQINTSSYLIVRGMTVLGMKGRTDLQKNVQPYGGEVVLQDHSPKTGMAIQLDHFTVSHANQTCIKSQDGEPYAVISNSTLLDCGQDGNGLDHGIYITGPSSSALGNTVTGTPGFGITFHESIGANPINAVIKDNTVSGAVWAGIIDDSRNGTISHNIVHDNGYGISMGHAETVEYNLVYNNNLNPSGHAQCGIGLIFGDSNSAFSQNQIDHNTIYVNASKNGCSGGAIDYTGGNTGDDGTNVIESNIFYQLNQWDGVSNVYAPGDLYDHNDYHSASGPVDLGKIPSGDPTSILNDPKFSNPPPGFSLLPGSPAVDTGIDRTNMGAK